jgi:hypothetical protein
VPEKGFRFFRVQDEILPGFLSSPHGTLVTGANVTRLIPTTKGGSQPRFERWTAPGRSPVKDRRRRGDETLRLSSFAVPESDRTHGTDGGRGFNDHLAVNFFASIPHAKNTRLSD